MLEDHFREAHPVLMAPLQEFSKDVRDFSKAALLTTLRKLEKQAKLSSTKLPRVMLEIPFLYGSAVGRGQAPASEKYAILFATKAQNPHLLESIFKYTERVPDSKSEDVFYPSLYAMIFLHLQGMEDSLKK